MKLSDETLAVLKSFSGINQSILFKEGNVIKTISLQKTLMATATVPDEFPQEVGIYNLPRFLSAIALYESPELEFGPESVLITEGKSNTRYFYANASMIVTPPDKEIKLPSVDVSFDLSADNFSKVMKAVSVLQSPEVAFVGEGGTCYFRAIDSSNPTSDSFGVELGETEDSFTLIMKPENMQLMPIDYKVELSSKGISKFAGENVTYHIAIESKSTYEKG